MINEDIVRYLKEGIARGFSLDFLKQKLLEAGFNEYEINEAASYTMNNTTTMNKVGKTNIKWLKIAGIIGIVFMIYVLIYSLIIFIPSAITAINNLLKNTPILFIFILIISFILTLIFYFGFVKLGGYAESKLLKFSSWFIIIFFIVSLVLTLIATTYIFFWAKDLIDKASPLGLTTFASEPLFAPNIASSFSNFKDINQNKINIDNSYNTYLFGQPLGLFKESSILSKILFYFILFLGFIYITIQILFSVSLIKIRDKIKFTMIGGVLHLTEMIILLLMYLFLIYIIFINPLVIFSILPFLFDRIFLIIVIIFMILLSTLTLLFESLALFDGSKQFE